MQFVFADYDKLEHENAILYLMDCYAKDPMGGNQALDKNIKKQLVAGLKRYATAFSILAFKAGKPAGLVNCFESFSTFKCKPLINIHDLIVSPDYRSLGIAKQLLKEVDKIALARGCCKITLEVLKGNKKAQLLYNQHGFAAYELSPEYGQAQFWEKNL
ncbi:MAG: GNAT family N-acetyltransferase [Pseudomonadales bacterium]|nr:GNAT family N-acetyltransferase [Pseudomonadales bacterium]